MTDRTDYLVIGHITVDYTPVGLEYGGTALFAAITAVRLGARVRVLTSMPTEEIPTVLPPEVEVHNLPVPKFCTFVHEHHGDVREQYITEFARTLCRADVPDAWKSSPLVHVGPIAQEVDRDLLDVFQGALLGASVQGWLRRWDRYGHVEPLPFEEMLAWAPPVECSFLSEEDIAGNQALIDLYRRHHSVVVLTDGAHGATVYQGPSVTHIPAFPVQELDSNGAGDVFSAAFLLRYQETRDPLDAARFASVVASFHVEHIGVQGLPSRAQAEERLLEYARL